MTRASLLALLTGCASSIEPEDEPAPFGQDQIEQSQDGDVWTMIVDATSEEAWVAYDLDTAAQVDPEGDTWDLAFQRFNVDLNDDGGAVAAVLDDTTLDEVTEPPADGFGSDSLSEDGPPLYVFKDWYTYNYATHTLSANVVTYVVQTTEGAYAKIQLFDYYDDAGTPAVLHIEWALL